MKKRSLAILLLLLVFLFVFFLIFLARENVSTKLNDQYGVEKVASIEQPIQLLPAPGNYKGDLVLTSLGDIYILNTNIPPQLIASFNSVNEFNNKSFRALSMAFAHNWPKEKTGYLYTAPVNSTNPQVIVWRYEINQSFQIDPERTRKVISIPLARPGHDGGMLHADKEGNLWLAVGDGNCCGDPRRWAQDGNRLVAKMLRIRPKDSGGYTIPPDNPFVGQKDIRPETIALGLRNPWRWSFQGDEVWIADVGENDWEEVNVLSTKELLRGANFGWSRHEGPGKKNTDLPLSPLAPYIPPTFAYPHRQPQENDICYNSRWGEQKPVGSISGGTVIDKPLSAKGRYAFADFCFGSIFLLQKNRQGAEELKDKVPYPVSVDRGFNGDTYILSAASDAKTFTGGAVYRLIEK